MHNTNKLRDETTDESMREANKNDAKSFADAVARAKGALGKDAGGKAALLQAAVGQQTQTLGGPATSAGKGGESVEADENSKKAMAHLKKTHAEWDRQKREFKSSVAGCISNSRLNGTPMQK